jgi:DNA-binding CsgD family transcriptional regulator
VTTRRARVAVGLAAQGLSNFQIAERVGVSVREIKFLLDHTLTELGVSSREELSRLL